MWMPWHFKYFADLCVSHSLNLLSLFRRIHKMGIGQLYNVHRYAVERPYRKRNSRLVCSVERKIVSEIALYMFACVRTSSIFVSLFYFGVSWAHTNEHGNCRKSSYKSLSIQTIRNMSFEFECAFPWCCFVYNVHWIVVLIHWMRREEVVKKKVFIVNCHCWAQSMVTLTVEEMRFFFARKY